MFTENLRIKFKNYLFLVVFYIKDRLIAFSKLSRKKDSWHCIKDFYPFGYEWRPGLSRFGCRLNTLECHLEQKGNIFFNVTNECVTNYFATCTIYLFIFSFLDISKVKSY